MYKIIISETFDAAHFIEGYNGACSRVHGHTWKVEVVYLYEDEALGKNKRGKDGEPVVGMLSDFGVLRDSLRALLPDHEFLNEIFDWNPTAENIAKWLSDLILIPHESVRVWESDHCSVAYFPDQEIFDPRTRVAVDLESEEVVGQVKC